MCARVLAPRDLARPRERRVEIDRGIEIASDQAPLVGRAEFEPGVAHRIARGLAEAAMAGPAQQLGEPHQLVDLIARATPIGDLVERIAHQRRADAAWRTEAAALVREEMREIACDLEEVPLLAEDHEGAGGRHVLEGDMAAELVRRQADAR